ncbi:NmrA family transcriptional regulator [Deinococcus sp. Arct2-2]|uniref:SDR family oxidoreductase n=1 Tax=Deinococcus sp. Arct2-2 TaxID=2568653 RepID=UPI0010A48516|nr:NmrA family NAD(P)-binding protein [Deinococcus sp. Arct2-2]THF71713.1 NmrA family transcriptional regulator [Deinococcus sp. Arct2-2]
MSDLTLVYGATGEQGGPVAQEILKRGAAVRVMVRRPERAAYLAARGAEVLVGDIQEKADVQRAFEGVTRLSLTLPLGGDPLAATGLAVQAAKAAGVRRMVLNTSGQTPDTPTGVPMMDYRLPLEQLVRESGLSALILRPTAYLQNLLGPWARPAVVADDTLAYPIPDTHRVSWLAAEDLGPLTAEALERSDLTGHLNVGGPEALTGPELAAHLSDAVGRHIRYQATTPEAFGGQMAQVFGPEMGEAATRAYRLTWEGAPDAMAINPAALHAALPVIMTSFADWLALHSAAFQPESTGMEAAQ